MKKNTQGYIPGTHFSFNNTTQSNEKMPLKFFPFERWLFSIERKSS